MRSIARQLLEGGQVKDGREGKSPPSCSCTSSTDMLRKPRPRRAMFLAVKAARRLVMAAHHVAAKCA